MDPASVEAELPWIFRTKSADAWEERLAEAEVPAARVRTLAEVLAHPQMAGTPCWLPLDQPGVGTVRAPAAEASQGVRKKAIRTQPGIVVRGIGRGSLYYEPVKSCFLDKVLSANRAVARDQPSVGARLAALPLYVLFCLLLSAPALGEEAVFPHRMPDKKPEMELSSAMERMFRYPAPRVQDNELFSQFKYTPLQGFDNNGGDAVMTAAGVGVGGSAAIYMDGATNAADEWIITPAAMLNAAASYRVGFEFTNWQSVPVSIEVAHGSSPNPASMTTFATFSNIGSGTFTAKDLWINAGEAGDPYFNTPPSGGGMYYLGIHVVTAGTGYSWSMDNIKLDDNPSPPPKIGYAVPGSPIASFIENDTQPIVVSVNYKNPGLVPGSTSYHVPHSSTSLWPPRTGRASR